jgi:L-ribulose-5-phosphate 3-epimerase
MSRLHRLGVCSWSLQPTSPTDLAHKLSEVGVSTCQLHLDPLREGAWDPAQTLEALWGAGISVLSGMMTPHGEDYSTLDSIRASGGLRPSEHWQRNLEIAKGDARIARSLGLSLVTFHAGFLPHDVRDPERAVLLGRLRQVVDVFADQGVHLAFETGQETADTLLHALAELDRPRAGVNFDPANMLLYGMGDPIAALGLLAPHVRQIHIKDARRTKVPGTWGEEVPVGTGEVNWKQFFAVVAARDLSVDLMIEREAGNDRVGDIVTARKLVEQEIAK